MTEEFVDYYFDLNSYWNLILTTFFINSNRNYRWPRIEKKITHRGNNKKTKKKVNKKSYKKFFD